MSKPYHRTGPPGEELILDWASDLTPDQRNSLYDVLDGELERRDKGRIPAARFIARITTARRYKKVAKWVQYIQCRPPALGDLPDYATTLAYGLADGLDSEEFTAYTDAMGYCYWSDDEAKTNLIELTKVMWSLPTDVLRIVAFEWYRHVLKNTQQELPKGTKREPGYIEYSDAHTEFLGSPGMTSETTFLEEITCGKVRLVHVAHLGASKGILLTGPCASTIITSSRDRGQHKMASHLIGHFLLNHTQRGKFSAWIEGELPSTIRLLEPLLNYEYLEEEAELAASCLLEPMPPGPTLSPKCYRLVATLREVGVPKHIVPLLFRLRQERGIPIVALLQKQIVEIDDPVHIPEPKTEASGIVLDKNNQIYLVRGRFDPNPSTDEGHN